MTQYTGILRSKRAIERFAAGNSGREMRIRRDDGKRLKPMEGANLDWLWRGEWINAVDEDELISRMVLALAANGEVVLVARA